MTNDVQTDSVLEEARLSFPSFYSISTVKDSSAMDELVLVWSLLTQRTNFSREVARPAEFTTGEPIDYDVKRRFMRARFLIRNCDTFRSLAPAERNRIAGILFEPSSSA